MSAENKRRHTVETISPQQAASALASGNNVRRLNQSHVNTLARAMKTGVWRLNGESVKFDRDGKLVDGQHRMRACVVANVPFQTYVVYGLHGEDVVEIDTGKRRAAGQLLAVRGAKHAGQLGTAARLLFFYLHGNVKRAYSQNTSNVGGLVCSTTEIMRVVEEHPGLEDSVARCIGASKIMPMAILAMVHYLAQVNHQEAAECFVDDVVRGAGLKMDSPAYQLRERMLTTARQKGMQMRRDQVWALTIKAWNLYVAGTPCKLLRITAGEEFPKMQTQPLQ